jgi:hypothetical protein
MPSIRAKIRKLTLGSNPKDNGIAFQVGNRAGGDEYIISEILEDTNHFFSFGSVRFLVFIQSVSNNQTFLWKSFQDLPTSVEYFLPSDSYKIMV